MSQDPVLLKFLQQAQDDIAVTKYLYNMQLANEREDPNVSKYLNGGPSLGDNDISTTKFLSQQADDISVTKFLGEQADDISVTKFLEQ